MAVEGVAARNPNFQLAESMSCGFLIGRAMSQKLWYKISRRNLVAQEFCLQKYKIDVRFDLSSSAMELRQAVQCNRPLLTVSVLSVSWHIAD